MPCGGIGSKLLTAKREVPDIALKDTSVHADKPTHCKLFRALEQFDKTDRATFLEWIMRGFSSTRIEKGFREAGVQVSRSVIDRHLGGECACPDGVDLRGHRAAKR